MSDPAISVEGLSKVYKVGANPFEAVTPIWRRDRGPDRRGDDAFDDDDALFVDEEPEEERGPIREVKALVDVSLEVDKSARLAILGGPGAGKSTLLKVLGRITPPTAGRAVVRGRVVPLLDVASGLMNPDLSGRKNAIMLGRLFGTRPHLVERHLDAIAALAGVEGRIRHPARTYSARQYRRLGIAVALNLKADVLLVDDRILSGDQEFAALCAERLHAAAAGGATLLMAASEPATVGAFCDEAIWMAGGRIVERRPLAVAAPRQAARATARRRPDAAAAGLDALTADQRAIVEELVVRGRSYDELAARMEEDAAAIRRRAHASFEALAPDGGRLTAEDRAAVVDHLLGQRTGAADPLATFARSETRVWAGMIGWYLEPLAPGALAAVPAAAAADRTAAGGGEPLPEVDVQTAALVDFVEASLGEAKAREALTLATDKAIWKELPRVKWADVGEAAGIPHEDAKVIVDRLVRLRAFARPALQAHAFDGRVALVGAALRDRAGRELAVLRAGGEAIVEAVVEATVPGAEVLLQVVLESPDAPPLRLSQPEPFAADEPGRYCVRAHLAGAALDEARYTARVSARVRLGGQESRLERAEAFAFEVYEDGGDGAAEEWEGPPLLAWEVRA